MDIFPAHLQRQALISFALALGSADTATRRDECGDPLIIGLKGRIYATPDGWQLIVETPTARAWSAAKKRLSFARLLRDGDTEGAFHLDTLPDAEQAVVIRSALGIRKHREVVTIISKPDGEELSDLAMLAAMIPASQLERSHSVRR